MYPKIKIAASILAADPAYFAAEIKKVEKAGVDLIHIDVMDGHFVPNITMGPFIIEGIKKVASVPLDIHLMIEHPEKYIAEFARVAGTDDFLVFHIEATRDPEKVISMIRKEGLKAAVSLNPGTHTGLVEGLLDMIDMVLVMSVNPGFAGQKFIPEVLPKITRLRSIAPEGLDIEVDGGINAETVSMAVQEGANVIVAASAIFKDDNPARAVGTLRQIAEQVLEEKCHRL